MKRAVKLCIGTACVAVLLLAGFWSYRALMWVEMDLHPLTQFARTQNYQVLIQKVKAVPPAEEGFSFVVLGDTRSFYHRALNVITRAAQEKPSFILSNGDIVRRGTVDEYIDHHLRLVDTISHIPFIVAPGNHERGPNRDFAAFKALFGDLRFSFDYGGCRFVGINNGDFDKMGADDLTYLETELSKPGASHKFVIFHVPPEFLEQAIESEGSRGFSWNSRAFHAIMTKHKVTHVFAGHVHGYASEVIDGVRYTITGGGGANLTEALGDEARVHHFILIHVKPEGVQSEVVKFVEGEWHRESVE